MFISELALLLFCSLVLKGEVCKQEVVYAVTCKQVCLRLTAALRPRPQQSPLHGDLPLDRQLNIIC